QVQIDSLGLPTQNSYRDSLTIQVDLTTTGHFAESGTLKLLINGVIQQTQATDSIRFGERTGTALYLAPQPPGYHTLRVEYSGESTAELDTSFWIGIEPTDLIINEIMPWPESGEPEWVEILNRSPVNIPVNVMGVGDVSTIGWNDTTGSIAPSDLLTVTQEATPFGCENTLTSWPGFGNSADGVRIVDRTGRTIDSLAYDADWLLKQGQSLERIWPDSASTALSNWQQHPENGTPCELNMSTPLPVDLALTGVQFDTTTLVVDTVSPVTFQVTNLGYETSSGGKLWFQVNGASSTSADTDLPAIPPDSTISVPLQWPWETAGLSMIHAWLDAAPDQNPGNDSLMTPVFITYDDPTLLLTEIMYLPASTDREWIEIYNTSADSIQINDWSIADASQIVRLASDSAVSIPPDAYFVIQAPGNPVTPSALSAESFPNLNNTGDFLGILDPLGNWIDSLSFTQDWGDREGISLERIRLNAPTASASNWGNAVSPTGSTPGEQNSLFLDAIPKSLTLTISPNPFSPDDDGFEDFQTISYTLPFESGSISAEIFDVYGRKMATLAENQPVAAIGEIVWDGSWDYTHAIRMGIYILKFRADDHHGHVYQKLVKTYIAR
ncbi:MAG: lamin tail domain-containing protein, partial [Candidatus Marinimicrobia bacterium]|nr:lamin tail domain-containing protein [Candidatus Neomarinimicrobiota bacterium]MCF7840642.1 lamin tail domain-containing protein [Candidatus Neomarinimicrobiota bacterium]